MVLLFFYVSVFFFFKQKTAYEMRISDWSSDVCSSDLQEGLDRGGYFRLDYAGDFVEATFGGELRVGDIRAKRFVNRGGKRGALRVNAEIGRASCRERVCQYV